MSTRRVVALASSLALAAAGALAVVPAATASATPSRPHPTQSAVCPAVPVHYARCLAHVLHPTPQKHGGSTSTTPRGFSPTAIKKAYGFARTGGAGETIAVVDAYGASTITSNLRTFSNQYTLPTCTQTGCFTVVNQTGGRNLPRSTSQWALEQSLDAEWAHAMAPTAHILLVEASSSRFTTLLAAVRYAATTAHAKYVSMSWGGTEFSTETKYNSTFATSGVSYFAAAGDSASAVIFPSVAPSVVSVGGTTLHVTSTGAWTSESAWSTAGGGCSRYETANVAQETYLTANSKTTLCSRTARATPDISLDANPNTGVAVYDTETVQGLSGWIQVGGTSASTVMIAAHAAAIASAVNASYVYGSSIHVYDVTSGSNGHPCETGYDLCTGVGSWNTSTTGGTSGTSSSTGRLAFTSATTTVTAGTTAALTLRATHATTSSATSVTVHLSSTGSGELSTSTSGTFHSSLTVTITVTTTTPIYFKDAAAGTVTVGATATKWTSATKTLSVTTPGTSSPTPLSVTVAHGTVVQHGPWYHMPLTVTVTEGSTSVSGAAVVLSIYAGSSCTGNAVTSGSGTTGSNGKVAFTYKTRTAGTYCAEAVATTGAATGSGTTTFSA